MELNNHQAKLEVSAVGTSLLGKPADKLNFLVPMAQRSTQTVVDFNLFTSASGLKPATIYEAKFKVWMLSGKVTCMFPKVHGIDIDQLSLIVITDQYQYQ